ncbi:caspase family protein [Streptomyces sp. NPDC049040]|uniref:caspase family protein n=1 Tax=Streptomyces sp. NPDC049040 TaxID=3365593 RepID=UPI003711FA1A
MADTAAAEPGGASGRRFAIAVGVSRYAEPFGDLPQSVADAQRVADLLGTMGYERVLPEVSADPTSAELLGALGSWSRQARLGPDDVVVAYFTGHGVLHQNRHYLLGAGDDGEDLAATAVLGADFVATVASSLAGNTLVIIDACYAGATTQDAMRSLVDLGAAPPSGAGATWVLAAAGGTEVAWQGALVAALEQTVTQPWADTRQRYLGMDQVTDGINRHFDSHGVTHRAVTAGWGASGVSPFFPNPAYVPAPPPDPQDRMGISDVARLRRNQQAHFLSRSRGVAHASETGDLFTGRVAALRAVADWLGRPRDEGGLLVVTGGPGSGKSALLGRFLALTDPDSTARLSVPDGALPPPGLSVTAMNCRHATVEDVTTRLSAALGGGRGHLREAATARARRGDPFVVMLDGLDEAVDSGRIIAEVIEPLALLRMDRVIVGVRRSLLPALGAADVIDLDTPKYRDDDDLRAYARLLLEGRGGGQDEERSAAYRADPARAATDAALIARQAAGSFLTAQLLARALLNGANPAALRATGDAEPFAHVLEAFGRDKELVVRLLLPLAYAQGSGLPRALWAPLAEALAHTACTDAEVGWFLARDDARGLVTESRTADGTVHRLVHENLAEYLTGDLPGHPAAPGDSETAHRLIAEVLIAQVPVSAGGARVWAAAHPYIREHLAAHAGAGRVLPALVRDDDYVRHAASKPLLHALLDAGVTEAPRSTPESGPSGDLPEADPAEQVVSRILSDRVTVLVVATEWSSAHGGLSTFSRHLCIALAAAGATVFCSVVTADDPEIADAAAKHVTLLCHPGAPGAPDYGKLTRRPQLPPGVEPDLIIGHARITGPAAVHLQEDYFPRARRLHVVHMAPDEIEWHKLDDSTAMALRAEERTEIERRLGASAHRVFTVGPRLLDRFRNELCDSGGPEPVRIDPGFDLPESGLPAPRTPPPGNPFKVLMMGRTEDAPLKGIDLGARACGLVHELRTKASTEPIELVVRGAPTNMADMQQERIRDWSGAPGLDVVVRAFSRNPRHLDADLARASLVIMPSRREGFGLVGLEAIIRGVPLLASGNSGLALLLREFLRGDADPLIVPVTRDDELDADTWAARIERCLSDREAAFDRMTAVRSALAARVTWAAAAALVLGEAP